MHFVGPDQLHGFEERLTPDVYPAGLDWTPDWRAPVDERLPWYHTMESVLRPGVSAASMQVDYDDEVCFHSVRAIFDLRARPDEAVLPGRLLHAPARPMGAPGAVVGPLRPRRDRAPGRPGDPLRRGRPAQPAAARHVPDGRRGLTDEQIRRARHAYFAAISYVDDRIGQVLGALAEAGLDDETIVVFTADHGEMLGERGLWYKMAFFEDAARVPLLIAPRATWPASPGRGWPSRSRCSTSPRRCSTSRASSRHRRSPTV